MPQTGTQITIAAPGTISLDAQLAPAQKLAGVFLKNYSRFAIKVTAGAGTEWIAPWTGWPLPQTQLGQIGITAIDIGGAGAGTLLPTYYLQGEEMPPPVPLAAAVIGVDPIPVSQNTTPWLVAQDSVWTVTQSGIWTVQQGTDPWSVRTRSTSPISIDGFGDGPITKACAQLRNITLSIDNSAFVPSTLQVKDGNGTVMHTFEVPQAAGVQVVWDAGNYAVPQAAITLVSTVHMHVYGSIVAWV